MSAALGAEARREETALRSPLRSPRLLPPVSEYFLNWVSWSSPGKENKPSERARMGGTGLGEYKSSSYALGISAPSQPGVGGVRTPGSPPSVQLCPAVPLHLPPSLPSDDPHLGGPNLLVKPSWGCALRAPHPLPLCWTPRDPHLRSFLHGHHKLVATGMWG